MREGAASFQYELLHKYRPTKGVIMYPSASPSYAVFG